MQGILDQQQADRDWWMQAQQEQIAERRARAAQLALLHAAADLNSTPGASELIQWPPVLRGPRFAEQRARIEAPYRRGGKVPSAPTAKDYQDMIETTAQIKTTLKAMAADITAKDYLDATAFLDYLAAEARGHIQKAPAKSW
jgi:hypothetical protein